MAFVDGVLLVTERRRERQTTIRGTFCLIHGSLELILRDCDLLLRDVLQSPRVPDVNAALRGGNRTTLSNIGLRTTKGPRCEIESGTGNRIKVEGKRYRGDSSLDVRDLTAELTQAIRSDPNLDLWVLAASRPVRDQIAQDLEEQAAENGVEVLMLDVGTDGLPRLPVLMAAYPHVVRDWLGVHQHGESPALMSALDAVASSPLFQDAAARIVSKLAGTMLGYESAVIRCKTRLLDALTDERRTKAQFGQRMAIREPGRLPALPRSSF